MTQPENESLVQEFYDQWNSGAIDFDRLAHAEIANHQPEREPDIGPPRIPHGDRRRDASRAGLELDDAQDLRSS